MPRRKKRVYEVRDDMIGWSVSIWRDAMHFKLTQKEVLDKFDLLYADPRWKKLTRYEREFVRGWNGAYRAHVVERLLEYGDWVEVPWGGNEVVWFGVGARSGRGSLERDAMLMNRLTVATDGSPHRWIAEHAVEGRSGIYWAADAVRGVGAGEKPFFISPAPAVDDPGDSPYVLEQDDPLVQHRKSGF